MPRRDDLESILIIGAGPIVIGQACEFDYSGDAGLQGAQGGGLSRHPRELESRDDHDRSRETADAIYIEPINWRTVARDHREGEADRAAADDGRPDGAQLRARPRSRRRARATRRRAHRRLARSDRHGRGPRALQARDARHRPRDAARAASRIRSRRPGPFKPRSASRRSSGRRSRSGGSGGGIAYNREEFEEIVSRGLDASPTGEVLVEESVIGWKEFEMEVVRDRNDNCIIICSIENLDPMGVHTGDSITVAPAQTLTDKEYQRMRDASIAVLRKIGVDTGGSNVQFALNPQGRPAARDRDEPARVALLRARVEGDRLPDREGRGEARGRLHARRAQERHHRRRDAGLVRADDRLRRHQDPALHVREIPGKPTDRLTTQMKSVGEVMAIGRTFQESLQKALRGLETGVDGLNPIMSKVDWRGGLGASCAHELQDAPAAERLLVRRRRVPRRAGRSTRSSRSPTSIRWFLAQIEEIVALEKRTCERRRRRILDGRRSCVALKRKGFSRRAPRPT